MKYHKVEMSLDPADLSEWERKALIAVALSDVRIIKDGWRGQGKDWSPPLVMFFPSLIEKKLIYEIGEGSVRALALTHDGGIVFERMALASPPLRGNEKTARLRRDLD